MASDQRYFKYLVGWLIVGTKGGLTRARIIQALKNGPKNANQLANALGLDYKTVRHHLEVLVKNGMVLAVGEGYGTTYFLSETMEKNYPLFEEVLGRIGKKIK
ncbi:MAG: winged helix-turn-helix domain-containing protein [Candidatus Nezhaarchaeota archaeon]|nr:winged helix-turn-helix domain-containing protein [Candidatus Nezhaarchaeota archaeon]